MVKLVFYLLYCCAAIKSCGLLGILFKAIPHRMFAMQVCHVPDYDKGQFVAALLQQTAQLKRLREPETDPGRLTVDKKFGHFLGAGCQCYRMVAKISGVSIDLGVVNFFGKGWVSIHQLKRRAGECISGAGVWQTGIVCRSAGKQQHTAAHRQIKIDCITKTTR